MVEIILKCLKKLAYACVLIIYVNNSYCTNIIYLKDLEIGSFREFEESIKNRYRTWVLITERFCYGINNEYCSYFFSCDNEELEKFNNEKDQIKKAELFFEMLGKFIGNEHWQKRSVDERKKDIENAKIRIIIDIMKENIKKNIKDNSGINTLIDIKNTANTLLNKIHGITKKEREDIDKLFYYCILYYLDKSKFDIVDKFLQKYFDEGNIWDIKYKYGHLIEALFKKCSEYIDITNMTYNFEYKYYNEFNFKNYLENYKNNIKTKIAKLHCYEGLLCSDPVMEYDSIYGENFFKYYKLRFNKEQYEKLCEDLKIDKNNEYLEYLDFYQKREEVIEELNYNYRKDKEYRKSFNLLNQYFEEVKKGEINIKFEVNENLTNEKMNNLSKTLYNTENNIDKLQNIVELTKNIVKKEEKLNKKKYALGDNIDKEETLNNLESLIVLNKAYNENKKKFDEILSDFTSKLSKFKTTITSINESLEFIKKKEVINTEKYNEDFFNKILYKEIANVEKEINDLKTEADNVIKKHKEDIDKKLAEEKEKAKQQEEERIKKENEEKARIAEEARKVEEARKAEEARLAEEKRKAEEEAEKKRKEEAEIKAKIKKDDETRLKSEIEKKKQEANKKKKNKKLKQDSTTTCTKDNSAKPTSTIIDKSKIKTDAKKGTGYGMKPLKKTEKTITQTDSNNGCSCKKEGGSCRKNRN